MRAQACCGSTFFHVQLAEVRPVMNASSGDEGCQMGCEIGVSDGCQMGCQLGEAGPVMNGYSTDFPESLQAHTHVNERMRV